MRTLFRCDIRTYTTAGTFATEETWHTTEADVVAHTQRPVVDGRFVQAVIWECPDPAEGAA